MEFLFGAAIVAPVLGDDKDWLKLGSDFGPEVSGGGAGGTARTTVPLVAFCWPVLPGCISCLASEFISTKLIGNIPILSLIRPSAQF